MGAKPSLNGRSNGRKTDFIWAVIIVVHRLYFLTALRADNTEKLPLAAFLYAWPLSVSFIHFGKQKPPTLYIGGLEGLTDSNCSQRGELVC